MDVSTPARRSVRQPMAVVDMSARHRQFKAKKDVDDDYTEVSKRPCDSPLDAQPHPTTRLDVLEVETAEVLAGMFVPDPRPMCPPFSLLAYNPPKLMTCCSKCMFRVYEWDAYLPSTHMVHVEYESFIASMKDLTIYERFLCGHVCMGLCSRCAGPPMMHAARIRFSKCFFCSQ